jgi:hypothetical protein
MAFIANMNAPLLPQVLGRSAEPGQAALPLESPGVQRWIWQGRYGQILIEVIGEQIFVNGSRVECLATQGQAASRMAAPESL